MTANQKIVADGYPYWLGADWVEPYRAARIEAMLSAERSFGVDDFVRMQLDVTSGPARSTISPTFPRRASCSTPGNPGTYSRRTIETGRRPGSGASIAPMLTDRAAVEAAGGETLVLEPHR